MKNKVVITSRINLFFLMLVLCFFSETCFAFIYDDYNIDGVANIVYDQLHVTDVTPGIYNYSADRIFSKYGQLAEACFTPTNGTKNIDGYSGIKLSNGHNFFLLYGYRNESGTHLTSYSDKTMKIPDKSQLIVSLATQNSGTKFTGTFSIYTQIGSINACNDGSNSFGRIVINMTVTVSNSTCEISTSHNMAFFWPSLSPSSIQNGSAEMKNAPVRMDCTNATGAFPVAVTFNSTNGSYDAANGIVKTNHENLGLQLTWANTGKPIPQNTEIDFPATSNMSEDFSVNAIPVQLGSGEITGGDFSTSVTMSIEYR
ncbi:hypothetical protein C3Z09_07325 [Lelliottia aquatilis]|uniref:fimbrial protein n=1 Tax=Lelliottia aquatilis TaxID=2080838 RepID=UPI000CDEDED2|nr:fimbrial protein [Lelliottia aquatilis]POZ17535.1 hypothetical protein C3Z09_07325 [Lelliottia aquatilis]